MTTPQTTPELIALARDVGAKADDEYEFQGITFPAIVTMTHEQLAALVSRVTAAPQEGVSDHTKPGELLPCPFCGHDTPEFERKGTNRQSCIVECGWCGARHESADEGDASGTSWNTRVAAPESPQPIPPRFQQTYCQRCSCKCGPGDDGPIDCGGHAARPDTGNVGAKDCPHAAPHRYCQSCVVTPCPIGLGEKK